MKTTLRRFMIPLAFYYAVTVVIPLANGAASNAFPTHVFVVLVVPPALILLFACGPLIWRFFRRGS